MSRTPRPRAGEVGVCKAHSSARGTLWAGYSGAIVINVAPEAKFLSWLWQLGVGWESSRGGCPAQQQKLEQDRALAQNTPKSICYSMAGLSLEVSDTQHTESA